MAKTDRLTLADVRADTVNVRQAAEIVGVSKDIAYEAIKAGEFPHRRIGGRIVIPVALLREWMGESRVQPPTDLQIQGHHAGPLGAGQ